ncbi:MAG: SOS response-associated peptidase family protein [Thiogranum sp.]|nr:SOS response-associated peptidase family protein [Thiogranum sp.]
MCGRYNLITDAPALVESFEIENALFDPDELGPRYNIAPGQSVPIVRVGEKGRELSLARWGLVPHWSKEEKPIPATGFYEWKQEDGSKTPYHIHMPEGGLFAFAGLLPTRPCDRIDHFRRFACGFHSLIQCSARWIAAFRCPAAHVPLPGAVLFFASGLLAFVGVSRSKK